MLAPVRHGGVHRLDEIGYGLGNTGENSNGTVLHNKYALSKEIFKEDCEPGF